MLPINHVACTLIVVGRLDLVSRLLNVMCMVLPAIMRQQLHIPRLVGSCSCKSSQYPSEHRASCRLQRLLSSNVHTGMAESNTLYHVSQRPVTASTSFPACLSLQYQKPMQSKRSINSSEHALCTKLSKAEGNVPVIHVVTTCCSAGMLQPWRQPLVYMII